MNLNGMYDFDFLKNEAEELVKDALAKEMEKEDLVCDCQDCILDIIGYTLNNIKPLYKTSLRGSVYTNAPDEQYLESLEKTLQQAIEKVKTNPSHG